MPFKANAARRHHIPKQTRKVTNWADYNASLRQRGSLTLWFSPLCQDSCRLNRFGTFGGADSRKWHDTDRLIRIG
jgi:hypothetical protein